MEDFSEVEAILREIAKDGVFSGMMADDLEELIRLIKPRSKEERESEGITEMETLDGNGNKTKILDGGRGIRLRICIC